MKGIYKITNIKNNKYYIGSSKNINKRLSQHKSLLNNNNHPNKKLQSSWNKYKQSSFKTEILHLFEDDVIDDQILELEDLILKELDRNNVFNLTFDAFGGGSDVLAVETFVLDLKGNIISKHKSTIDAYKSIGLTRPGYSRDLNTSTKSKKKYRIVTKNFYENNLELIKSWDPYSTEEKKIQYIKNYTEKRKVLIRVLQTNELLEFLNCKEAGEYFNCSRELIRLYRGKNTPILKKSIIVEK